MYDFNSALFQYKFVFIIELLATEIMVGMLYKKREHFLLRLGIFLVLTIGITFALPIIYYNAIYISILFTVMFGVSILLLKIVYNETYKSLMLCGIFGYAAQHISYVLGNYICNMAGIGTTSIYDQNSFKSTDIFSLLLSFAFYMIIYGVIFFYIVSKKQKQEEISINNYALVFISGAMLLVNVIMNAIVAYEFIQEYSKILLTVYSVYDTICAIFVIVFLFVSIRNNKLEGEINAVHLLWKKDKEIYQIKKDNIESLSIMCHDLRHRITALKSSNRQIEELDKIEDAIKTYDSVYKTGNEVLDIVLTESGLHCKDNDIMFVCLADGSLLNHFSENDLYSLFDNALHNAINAVEKIEKKEDRYIRLVISRKKDLVVISIENPYVEEVILDSAGIPLSKNKEKGLHGYGMKSIQMIVERYDGNLNINLDGNIFKISMVFPIKSN